MLRTANIRGVWSKGIDSMTEKELHLDGHDQVNVTRGQDSKKYADTTSFVVTAVTTNLVVTVLLL